MRVSVIVQRYVLYYFAIDLRQYITIRDINYVKRDGVVKYHVPEMIDGSLPKEVLDIIDQCDGVFLAARHLAANSKEKDDMDLNHRGGKPGIAKLIYSDDRFYSS